MEIAGTAGHHARPGKLAFVNGAPQIDSEKWLRANIAHAGESCLQCLVGVDNPIESARKRGSLHTPNRIVAVCARLQVRVAVDQPRKHPILGEINDRGPGRNHHLRRGRHFGNSLALDDQHHIVTQIVAGGVKQMAGLDVNCGRSRLGHNSGKC